MTVIPFPSRWPAPRCPLATDALADLVFSLVLDREAELQALVDAGHHGQKELDAVQAPVNPFTKRSNAALASAMNWNDRHDA